MTIPGEDESTTPPSVGDARGAPLVGSLAGLLGIFLGLAVAGLAGVELPSDLPFAVPLATFQLEITNWTVWGMVILLGVLSAYFLTVPGEIGGRKLARNLSVLTLLSSLVGVWTVAGMWALVAPTLPWTVNVPVAGLVILSPVLAAKAGKVRLLVRRRKVRPDSYQTLVEQRTPEARARIASLLERPHLPKGNGWRPEHKCPGCGKRNRFSSEPGVGQCTGCGTLLEVKRVAGSRKVTVERLAPS